MWHRIQNTEHVENIERQKNSFPKKQVQNSNVHKPVLKKTMTTQAICVKFSFEAPLRQESLNSFNE